jgi:hypothetical protein
VVEGRGQVGEPADRPHQRQRPLDLDAHHGPALGQGVRRALGVEAGEHGVELVERRDRHAVDPGAGEQTGGPLLDGRGEPVLDLVAGGEVGPQGSGGADLTGQAVGATGVERRQRDLVQADAAEGVLRRRGVRRHLAQAVPDAHLAAGEAVGDGADRPRRGRRRPARRVAGQLDAVQRRRHPADRRPQGDGVVGPETGERRRQVARRLPGRGCGLGLVGDQAPDRDGRRQRRRVG